MMFPATTSHEVAPWRLLTVVLVLTAFAPSSAPSAATASESLVDAPSPTNVHAVRLAPVPVPSLVGTDEAVRRALEKARSELDGRIGDEQIASDDLAELFGSTGRLYHAHLVHEPARICYQNAALLAPEDYRWPYYLGYLAQNEGQLEAARDSFEAAARLNADMELARFHLGQVYLELGQWGEARPLLLAAAAEPELRGAALFELGKLAYAQREFEQAAKWLEKALEASPSASRIHYTLALTYRSLGDVERARDHMSRRGEQDPGFPDPLVDSLTSLSTGQRMLFHYGMDAAQRREFATAADMFGKGIELEPDNVNARVSLARFLYLTGDREGALAELEQAERRAPGHPLAIFFLGVWYDETGDTQTAVAYYERTLDADPGHPGAHFMLADVRMGEGHHLAAARHYRATLAQDSDNSAARLREILALIQASAAHEEVRERLEAAFQLYPDRGPFGYLLAALLAASPESGARDGDRALVLAKGLYDQYTSPEHAELLAMAYAETGAFDAALALQGQAVEMALSANQWMLLPRLTRNLSEFQEGRPCRVPWEMGHLLSQAPPTSGYRLFRDYPAAKPF